MTASFGLLAAVVTVLASIAAIYAVDSPTHPLVVPVEGKLCVSVGEPLYPATTTVPLDEFRRIWGSPPFNYQITVNEVTMKLTVHTSNGNVGAAHVGPNGLVLPIVNCCRGR
jgi:hypothetical protein